MAPPSIQLKTQLWPSPFLPVHIERTVSPARSPSMLLSILSVPLYCPGSTYSTIESSSHPDPGPDSPLSSSLPASRFQCRLMSFGHMGSMSLPASYQLCRIMSRSLGMTCEALLGLVSASLLNLTSHAVLDISVYFIHKTSGILPASGTLHVPCLPHGCSH